jgi:hypothetical protein
MPDFTLRHPDTGDEYVVGNASDRARLLSQGYTDVTDQPTQDTPVPGAADDPAPTDTAPTAPAAAVPGESTPTDAGPLDAPRPKRGTTKSDTTS